MGRSSIAAFDEPDDYQDALRDVGGCDLVCTEPGAFRAKLTRIQLRQVQLLQGEENLARIAFIRPPEEAVLVSLPPSGRSHLIQSGVACRAGELAIVTGGQSFHEYSNGPCQWRAIAVSALVLQSAGRALTGGRFPLTAGIHRWRPPATALGNLAEIYDSAIRVNRTDPRVAAGAEAAHGLEQQLLEALVECMGEAPAVCPDAAWFHRAELMRRFEDLIRNRPGNSIGSITAALGAPLRSLRAVCAAYLGVTPRSYLRLRRLQLARRALQEGGAVAGGVSDVARRLGFGQMGRFAAAYRNQFGELPSATLRLALSR